MKFWCDLNYSEKQRIREGNVNKIDYLSGYSFDVKAKVNEGQENLNFIWKGPEMKTLLIADAHQQNEPKQQVSINMSGGSPHYAYIWLNDEPFTVYIDGETGQITVEHTR